MNISASAVCEMDQVMECAGVLLILLYFFSDVRGNMISSKGRGGGNSAGGL